MANPPRYPTPASETEEGRERLQAYYCALGRFVDMFAKAEMAAHLVLRHYAKMSTAAARVLLSGVRVDETKNRLQRLFESGLMDETDWKAAQPIFQQLGIINGCRNDILHHGAISIAEGDGLVTNAGMAHMRERIVGFPISAEILDGMTADLRKIIAHLHIAHMGRPPLRGGHPGLDAILRAPWQYKQQSKPLAESPKPARHPSKPTRQGRPKPSPE
jgi:hypothetical protein